MGDLGVWVHNEGRKPCEEALRLIEKFRKVGQPGQQAWKEAFFQFLDSSNSAKRRAMFDPALGTISDDIFKKMADEATTIANSNPPTVSVDLSKFSTFGELDNKLQDRRRFPTEELNVDAHHLIRQDLAKVFFPNVTEAQRRNMPAVLLTVVKHKDFERILRESLKECNDPPYGQDEVLDALQQAYSEFGRPELFPIARKWLIGPTP